jgi:hypothetical protein
MKMCEGYVKRFSLTSQDSGVWELKDSQVDEYNSIYNMLINKLTESGGEIPENMDLQVINKIYTCNDECVTPIGLVNVSLEYLAKILTFCKEEKIQWLVDVRECTDTHFKELSYFKVIVDCTQEAFVTMAKKRGFRYSAICSSKLRVS